MSPTNWAAAGVDMASPPYRDAHSTPIWSVRSVLAVTPTATASRPSVRNPARIADVVLNQRQLLALHRWRDRAVRHVGDGHEVMRMVAQSRREVFRVPERRGLIAVAVID